MTKWFLINANGVVVLGRDMQNKVQSKMYKNKENVTIITNWADVENLKPNPKSDNELIKKLKLQNKCILQWDGEVSFTLGVFFSRQS